MLATLFSRYDVEISDTGLTPDDVTRGMSLSFDTPTLELAR